ncbi:MAG TPA: hypothetical protein VMF90_10865 [Rhizobiaceae bacterium]|nr:hypothetical protein [Rhizobiaceae bacterium]
MIRFEQKKEVPKPSAKKDKETAAPEAPTPAKKGTAKGGKRPEKAQG